MYTRIFNHDGTNYVVETRDFDSRDLEELQTYVSNLSASVLSAKEIYQLLDNDLESGNYHLAVVMYKTLYKELLETFKETTIDEDNAEDIARMLLLRILEMGGLFQ